MHLELTGEHLTVGALAEFLADENATVGVSPEAIKRVSRCADFRRHLALGEKAYYGINTGFGRFSSTRIDPARAGELQVNLLRSHASGAGPDLPVDIVTLMIVLRINSLLRGHSGVSTKLIELLVDVFHAGITPVVPCYGSVGASGDLAPLAHLALVLIGEGQVDVGGKRRDAASALREAGLHPLALEAREGLALINGTQMMSAFAVRALVDLRRVVESAVCAAAMSVEAYRATDRAFDARIHALKPHPGSRSVASALRALVVDSEIIASHRNCDRVQDPYSFRCIPQVLGAVVDTMAWTQTWVEREINAVTDNPLLFPDDDDVISGGNFHGEHMAIALDSLAIAAAEVASIAERRIDKLIEGDDDVLPRCLIADAGLNSGLMISQYLAAALVSENKVHAHPASVDSIPTSMGFEDHVSMGSLGALKLPRVIDNVRRVVAIELMCAAQALEFHRGLAPGRGVAAVHAAVRERVPFIEHDTVLAPYVASLVDAIAGGAIGDAVRGAVGSFMEWVQD